MNFEPSNEKKHKSQTLGFGKQFHRGGSENEIIFPLAVPISWILGPQSSKIPEKSTFLTQGGFEGKPMNARGKTIKIPAFSERFISPMILERLDQPINAKRNFKS